MKLIITLIIFLFSTAVFPQTNWQKIPFDSTFNLYSLQFLDVNTGFVVGESNLNYRYKIFKTTNGGLNWISILDTAAPAIRFVNENTGISFWGNFDNQHTTLYRTTNSGLTWQTQEMDFPFYRSYVAPDSSLYLGGYPSLMKHSTNKGLNWTYIFYNQVHDGVVTNMNFYNKDTGVVHASYYKSISRTTDGGITWTHAEENYIGEVRYSKYLNKDTIFFAGTKSYFSNEPIFFKTTNGGLTFSYQIVPVEGFTIKSAYTFNYNRSFLTGSVKSSENDHSIVLETTNCGVSWVQSFIDTAAEINSISFPSQSIGYIAGSSGRLYKTTNGGSLTGISNANYFFPKTFSLSQNYPNPFNPSTIINYQLTINSNVSIKIYDNLGNEIETLVNEKQNPGSYSVDFNASSLPSGIYFYKLMTENFSETKKMVLVK
jgi:photosystem II stability/assembly factor-like uncharacterized protein